MMEVPMKRIVVLGGGMVGGYMARVLAGDRRFDVLLCDRDEVALESAQGVVAALRTRKIDLSAEAQVRSCASEADLVIGAVPGYMGFSTVRTVLETGRDIVDISFFPEDPYELDTFARKLGRTAVVDCGVMPGLGGMLGAWLAGKLDRAESLSILVGGLPLIRSWPLEYKAPFSPIDVIEEYTRPARFRRDGKLVVRPALSDPELVDLPGVGTLEAFNTDGLRTLLRNLEIPDMAEKTLRYPGHIEKMRMLRDLGFLSQRALEFAGGSVRPLDLTARLLFQEWKLERGEQEFTVMRVEVGGIRNGKRVTERVDLLDRTDPATGDSSMARTTGMPAVTVARLLSEGVQLPKGIVAPETLAADHAFFQRFLEEIAGSGVVLEFSSS
jgi:lysine 6-dehydrogenase